MTSLAVTGQSDGKNASTSRKPGTILEVIRRRFGTFESPLAPRPIEPLIERLLTFENQVVATGPRDGAERQDPFKVIPLQTDPIMGLHGPSLHSNDKLSAPTKPLMMLVGAEFSSCVSADGLVVLDFKGKKSEGVTDIAISVPSDASEAFMTVHTVASQHKAVDGAKGLAAAISAYCKGKVIEGIGVSQSDVTGRSVLAIVLETEQMLIVECEKPLSIC
jgi:hypothetical protein